jgi:hypothetical protein
MRLIEMCAVEPFLVQWYGVQALVHFSTFTARLVLINKTNKQNKQTKQTPWPLVRERTIPTERPPLVDEMPSAN